jgi:ATP-dependent helicase/nuclease subunit B
VRVRGKVDRVDVAPDPPRFAVYDYKTGRAVSPAMVERGLSFQLPVYLLALQANGVGQPVAGAFYVLRRADEVRKTGYLGDESAWNGLGRRPEKFYPPADFVALLDQVKQNLLTIDRLIREGKFNPSVWEEDDAGCRYCHFAAICRYNATRQLNMEEQGGYYQPEASGTCHTT